ncbi:protein CHROMATIN REMODELING 25 [Forsythia ovata]|uniref:Protein CHROMATIN REMODELING 25 n=1 Tax=Forsythia ovata TaxID=205694 RepID=A0ABD1QP14_9LAMI
MICVVRKFTKRCAAIAANNMKFVLDGTVESESTSQSCQSDKEDIGGFAGIAGCLHKLTSSEKQVGTPKEEDLANWGHHHFPSTIPDTIFQASAGDEVSFVFTNQVDGKLVPVESTVKAKTEEVEGHKNLPSFRKTMFGKATMSSQHQATLPLISSRDSVASSSNLKPPEKTHIKFMRTLGGKSHVKLTNKISPRNQTPPIQLSHAFINDDDFE